MISLLFTTCITALKAAHDCGKPKYPFIIAMFISAYVIGGWVATLIFLAPLIWYSLDTGAYQQAYIKNPIYDLKGATKITDKLIQWVTSLIPGPYETFKHRYGLIYCYLNVLIFSLPFLYTHSFNFLPLLLWPIGVRYFQWRYAVSYLFFFYSLGYFLSL